MKKIVYLFTLLIAVMDIYADQPLLKNEVLIYSFETKDFKQIYIAKDSTDKYFVYRMIKNDKIIMEFPPGKKDSWNKFTYSFYLRGGEISNDGMDLNYLSFVKSNKKYVLYDTYSASDSTQEIGIKIIDLIKKDTIDIPGRFESKKGSLINLRDIDLINKSDETYD
jgi:hypothetical protein